jgi:hypothetical protein
MAVEKGKLGEVLKQLPKDLQNEVLRFAQSLVDRKRLREAGGSIRNGGPSVRSFFGSWDSGNPRSADNDVIDADLAREYASSHEADS